MQREYYLSPKNKLTIEGRGGRNLGRCYNASYFKVTSLHPLDMEDLTSLRNAGMFMSGQEFICRYVTHDGKKAPVPAKLDWMTVKDVVPTGSDEVGLTLVKEDTWEIIGPSKNKMTTSIPYYVYDIECRVDSSD